MKATDLLIAQHKEVARLFKLIEKAKKEEEKNELFEEVARNICAHDAIEREIFYPACEEKMGMTDLLGEALVEHGAVEFSLYLADEAQGEDDFDYKVTVLSEIIEHHVREEEDEMFPKVEKALGAERLEELGEEMEARFEEAKEDDFRGPLHENLRQVLAGAMETVPESEVNELKAKKPTAKKTARKSPAKKAARAAS
jgi:hemerythrin-like domain-containing protein